MKCKLCAGRINKSGKCSECGYSNYDGADNIVSEVIEIVNTDRAVTNRNTAKNLINKVGRGGRSGIKPPNNN